MVYSISRLRPGEPFSKWEQVLLEVPDFETITEPFIFELLLADKASTDSYKMLKIIIDVPGARFNYKEMNRCRELFNKYDISNIIFAEKESLSKIDQKINKNTPKR